MCCARSGGTDGGVMQLAGQTIGAQSEHARNVCLGVATWGIVKHHEVLEQRVERVHQYDAPPPPPPAGAPPPKGARAPLEPNHSHFLFVDAGPAAEGQFGKEIALRAALEDQLCRPPATIQKPIFPVMVLLVVAGGVGTLTTVLSVLERRRPVVVISDSGGAATDIHRYCTESIMPTNELEPGDKGYEVRQSAVQTCAETLPRIAQLGQQTIGIRNKPMLSFATCSAADGARDPVTTERLGRKLSVKLLSAVLSGCEKALDAIMHPLSWSDPEMLRRQLELNWDGLSSDDLSRAFEQALVLAVRLAPPRSQPIMPPPVQPHAPRRRGRTGATYHSPIHFTRWWWLLVVTDAPPKRAHA